MAFNYNLSSSDETIKLISKVRFYLGDTVQANGALPDGSNFSDEEILLMLDLADDDPQAATKAFYRPLAARWASYADVTVGPRKEALSQVAKRWQEMAQAAEGAALAAAGSTSFVFDPIRNDGFYQEHGLQDA